MKLKIAYSFYVILTRIASIYHVMLPRVVTDIINAFEKLINFGLRYMVSSPP